MISSNTHYIFFIIFIIQFEYFNAQRNVIRFPGQPPSSSTPPRNIFTDLEVNKISTRFTASVGGRCVLSTRGEGSCLPLNDCPELRGLYQRGRRLTRQAFITLRSRICRIFGNNNIFFCCSVPMRSPKNPIRGEITAVNPNPSANSNLIPSLNECGISTVGRITGGVAIAPHSHPWLVNLGSQERGNFKQICGGTLITTRHVLTASHCFLERPGVTPISHARLGDHSLSREEATPAITLRITDRKSPGYNSRSQENDIELLELEKDVSYTANIRAICLPFDLGKKDFTGKSMTIVGWGDTFHRSNQGSDTPLQAGVPVVSKPSCLQSFSRQTTVVIDQRQICAGVGGEDACQGDSGGPMIYKDPQFRHYLLGIVSFGVECARPDFPGVYTYIPNFLDWIQSNL